MPGGALILETVAVIIGVNIEKNHQKLLVEYVLEGGDSLLIFPLFWTNRGSL
jgi:hypothetical protein